MVHRASPCLCTIKELVSSLHNNKERVGLPALSMKGLEEAQRDCFLGFTLTAERSSPRQMYMAGNDLPTVTQWEAEPHLETPFLRGA